jgi:hypothetical protein
MKPWGNIEKKKIPCTLPTKTKRFSGSIIRFIGGSSVIVCVTVIVGVTGDRAWVHKECNIMDEEARPLSNSKKHGIIQNGRMNV